MAKAPCQEDKQRWLECFEKEMNNTNLYQKWFYFPFYLDIFFMNKPAFSCVWHIYEFILTSDEFLVIRQLLSRIARHLWSRAPGSEVPGYGITS